MVLNYCFHDHGVDAIVRIEPSHGILFILKKRVHQFILFPPYYVMCILEFCSVYEYVAFPLPVNT